MLDPTLVFIWLEREPAPTLKAIAEIVRISSRILASWSAANMPSTNDLKETF